MDSCPCLKVHLLDICAKTSTDGWMDEIFIGYFSWIEEVPLWWEIGMHSSKFKNGCITWRRWDFNQPVCQDDFSHISHVNAQTNIDFLESTYFHSEAYCIILDWIISFWNLLYTYIYILYHIDIIRYMYIYIHTQYISVSKKTKMSFELRHVASAILARSSMASTFTSATTHDPRRDPATHRSLPWPRRTEKPHSVLQEFDGDTIPQLPKK